MESNQPSKINKDLILRERLAIERTIMANHSTLLAFLRTALYFSVAGLSLNNLLKISYGLWIEITCWICSGLLLIIGFANYFKQKKKIADSEKHVGDYKLDYQNDIDE